MVDPARLSRLLEVIATEREVLAMLAQRSDEDLVGDPTALRAAMARLAAG